MTSVPVLWWNANPDERIIARGYWDQGILEALFSGEAWSVPGGFTFDHEVVRGSRSVMPAPRSGAVVVVPARHNAGIDEVAALQTWFARLGWVLLILTGDEEGAFPWRMLRHPRMKLWLMTPQTGVDYPDGTRFLGSGWPPGIRDVLRQRPADLEPRLPWAFMGQVTHERRKTCADLLADLGGGELLATDGFTKGWPHEHYWLTMANSKAAPCPSGPVSPDSFRVFEALEAGCVPLADNRSPRDVDDSGYWRRLFGAVPFPEVSDWSSMPNMIDDVIDAWPSHNNRVFAWWQRQKRRMAFDLHDDIASLSGLGFTDGPARAITALVTSSACPIHPSTEHLDATLASIEAQLPGVEIVLAFDGLRPELAHREADYAEYVRRALWQANLHHRNVVPYVAHEWLHQANLTKAALDETRGRHLLFVEHDCPVIGEIDWQGIIGALDAGMVDMVRLHHETAIGEPHRHMMLDETPRLAGPVPLIRTSQWSQRPHVARTGWYRAMLRNHFSDQARAMIEDVMHGVCSVAWHEYGIAGWDRFKLAVYAPPGNMQRSTHLDSRRLVLGEEATGDPKFDMLFDYPGDTPEGAPRPGRRTT